MPKFNYSDPLPDEFSERLAQNYQRDCGGSIEACRKLVMHVKNYCLSSDEFQKILVKNAEQLRK